MCTLWHLVSSVLARCGLLHIPPQPRMIQKYVREGSLPFLQLSGPIIIIHGRYVKQEDQLTYYFLELLNRFMSFGSNVQR